MEAARSTDRLHRAALELAEARSWIGCRATDIGGSDVGRLEDVWVDAETGEPAWLLIREGRFGSHRHRLVPIAGASRGGGRVWLPFERDTIRSSPEIGAEEVLTAQLVERLRAHFGLYRPRRATAR